MYFARTFEELNNIACDWRREWGLGDTLKPNFFRVLKEEFPRHFSKFKLQPLPEDRMPGLLAFSDRGRSTIGLKQTVAIGADQVRAHPTEIVTEEIAHWILNHPGRRFRRTNDAREYAHEDIQIQESEARRLSALLRAPIHLAWNCSTAADLVEKFSFELDDAERHIRDLIRCRNRLANNDAQSNVVDIRDRALISGRQTFERPRWDLEENYSPPRAGLIAILDIELGSPRSWCVIHGFDAGGAPIAVDLRGPQKRFRLPFANNHIFYQFIKNVTERSIQIVGWYDPARPEYEIYVKDSGAIQNENYSGETCENCESTEVVRNPKEVECKNCGWKYQLQLSLNF